MSSEIERHARDTYHTNFGEWPCGDIRAIRDSDVPAHDILCGGFPCQSFSIAGKRMGFSDQTRGTLFFEIVRIVKARKPAAVFLENVANLLRHDSGSTYAIIERTLKDLGYTVRRQVLNASLYGAPTARRRLYIVAIRSDLGAAGYQFPEPTYTSVTLNDVLLPDSETDAFVVRNHPFHPDQSGQEAAACAEGHAVLQTLPVGRVGNKVPAKQGYRVYSANGHAVTFLHSGGGVGAQTGLYLINGRVRKLHPREMARCMGYPDSYEIPLHLSYEMIRRIFGNSVVVPVIRLIAANIVASLGQQPVLACTPSSHSLS